MYLELPEGTARCPFTTTWRASGKGPPEHADPLEHPACEQESRERERSLKQQADHKGSFEACAPGKRSRMYESLQVLLQYEAQRGQECERPGAGYPRPPLNCAEHGKHERHQNRRCDEHEQ